MMAANYMKRCNLLYLRKFAGRGNRSATRFHERMGPPMLHAGHTTTLTVRIAAFRMLLPVHLAAFVFVPLLVHHVYARNGANELGIYTPHVTLWVVVLVAARLAAQFCCAPELGVRLAARVWFAMWITLLTTTSAYMTRERHADGVLQAIGNWPTMLGVAVVVTVSGTQHALFALGREVTVLIITVTLACTGFKIGMVQSLEYAALQALVFGLLFAAWFGCTCALEKFVALQERNWQLAAEKEKLAWEATLGEKKAARPIARNGTLGEMQDQAVTDAAVSCACSCDHAPTDSPPARQPSLIMPLFTNPDQPRPPPPASEVSSDEGNTVTSSLMRALPSLCASSVMEPPRKAAERGPPFAPYVPPEPVDMQARHALRSVMPPPRPPRTLPTVRRRAPIAA